MSKEIVLSKSDFVILSTFIENHQDGFSELSLKQFAKEVSNAKVVEMGHLPKDLICLNSKVFLEDADLGTAMELRLVMPMDADSSKMRMSIFTPFSAALIGNKKGDVIEWVVNADKKKFKIIEVIHD